MTNLNAIYAAIEAFRSAKAKGRTDRRAHAKAAEAAAKVLGTPIGAWDCATYAQTCVTILRPDAFKAPEQINAAWQAKIARR